MDHSTDAIVEREIELEVRAGAGVAQDHLPQSHWPVALINPSKKSRYVESPPGSHIVYVVEFTCIGVLDYLQILASYTAEEIWTSNCHSHFLCHSYVHNKDLHL